MTLSNPALSDQLQISMRRINRDLERIVTTDPDIASRSIVRKSVLELIRSGGKRLRPIMVIVGSRFGAKPESTNVYQLAAVCEFIHAASLVHDDILDQADTRRGQPSLHKITDVKTAVQIGNYMMSRVLELLSARTKDRDRNIEELASLTTTQLCLGEYQQMDNRYNFDLTLEQYWEKTRNKTAVLMATSLHLGARASEADESVAKQLYEFGDQLGMAFQVRDDVLDLQQSTEVLGKPAGADLRNGQVTLPVLLAMEEPAIDNHLRKLHEGAPDHLFDEAITLIRNCGAIERALEVSHTFMQRAWDITEQLSGHPAHRDLQTLWHYFEKRTY
ncbi:polyprenyl synthetase family protein [Paenibacillus agilis]|uniref:Polyprenyl synthetase family protein n=1 Tax=Paenibacillus agilis TaxID=3020863 RepID=A0A559IPN4_9BACL|nr:polyprenyl synthetase family protein [Paenibacillus agilis]TVX89576.1 polyprenyl synthetase family protein [Paenibacillus agilis]